MQQLMASSADPIFILGLSIASSITIAFSAVFQGQVGAAGADALAETERFLQLHYRSRSL